MSEIQTESRTAFRELLEMLGEIDRRWASPEWNLASDQPSELHKLGAQMFVYGFYDDERDRICLAVAVDVGLMQWALANGELGYERRRRGDQSFLGIKYTALKELGAVLFTYDDRARQEVA